MFTLLSLLMVIFSPYRFQVPPFTTIAILGAAFFLFYGLWTRKERRPIDTVFLACMFVAMALLFYTPVEGFFKGAFVFFSFALDMAFLSARQRWKQKDPESRIGALVRKGKGDLKKRAIGEFLGCADDLTEITLKAMAKTRLRIVDAGVKGLESLACDYLTVPSNEAEGIYVLSSLLQRMQWIHFKAVKAHFEPLATQLMVAMGKMALFASRKNQGLAQLPLHFLGECARHAQDNQLPEASIKAILTLQETAMNVLEDPQVMKMSLKEVMIPLIAQLENLSKEIFKRDKTTSVPLLTQPFRDLKAALQSEKLASHPDTAWILQDLDRVLSEFEALEMILRTVPNIPGFSESSPQET